MKLVAYSYTEIDESNTYQYYLNRDKSLIPYLLDDRKNISSFYPDFKSALIFLYSYRSSIILKNGLKISGIYADNIGYSYHRIIKNHIQSILDLLNKKYKLKSSKIIVDSSPVLEKDLAYRSNLGFFGKNNLLINPKWGSFVMIGSLLLPITLKEKNTIAVKKTEDTKCLNCLKCIKSCPTKALSPFGLNYAKCISYLTLEDKSEAIDIKKSNYLLGCDECQVSCPYNKQSLDYSYGKNFITEFLDRDIKIVIKELESLSNRTFYQTFLHTDLLHLGKKRLLRNLRAHLV